MSNYISGSSITYTKNPNYFGKTTINGKQYQEPFVDSLVYPIITDEASAVAAVRTGKVDWWPTVPSSYGASLKQSSPTLVQTPWTTGEVSVLWVNRLDNQYLKNIQVRQALETATDFQTITNLEFPGGTLLAFPVAPGDPAYTPLQNLPASIQSQFSYNPTLAKQMLATAGFPNGFSLTLTTDSTNTTDGDIAQLLVNQWAKIGVQLTINAVDPTACESARMDRGYDILLSGQFSANNALNLLDNFGTGSGPSSLYLATDPLAAMYNKVVTDTDVNQQIADEKTMVIGVLEDAGFIPFADPVYLNCYWPWLKNYFGETDAGNADLVPMISSMWIDQSLKN
jgi:peptide/nickel transport system substrate-binding protein